MNSASSPVNNNVLCDYCSTSIITAIYSNGQFYCNEDCRESDSLPSDPDTDILEVLEVPLFNQAPTMVRPVPQPRKAPSPQTPQAPPIPPPPKFLSPQASLDPQASKISQISQIPQIHQIPQIPQTLQTTQASHVPQTPRTLQTTQTTQTPQTLKTKRYAGTCDYCSRVWKCNSMYVETEDAWYCNTLCKAKKEYKEPTVTITAVNHFLPLPSSTLVTVFPLRLHYRERHQYF